jgi:molecular chaperone DnaJ
MAPQREWFEKDYYAVLGVRPDASQKDVSKSYRTLARQNHPDANPGNAEAEERFKEISAAYDVLGDAAKRKEYDEVRRMVASGARPGGFGPGGGARFEDVGGFGDFLGDLFGRKGAGRRGTPGAGPQRGADLEADLHLSFLDAVRGVTTSVTLDSESLCSECHGTGAEPGGARSCPQCQGSGNIAVDQGPFSFSQVCPQCQGAGRLIDKACKRCRGRGTEVRRRDIKVRIPPGVQDGGRIRVKGRGAPGRQGGPQGDLWVRVHVAPHPVFGRRGRHDLTVRLPVTFTEAALGADVNVPTLDGPVTVRIPPGTPSGKTLRVRDKGASTTGGGRGDLLVTVEVAVPQTLTDEERRLLEALAGLDGENPRRHLEGV